MSWRTIVVANRAKLDLQLGSMVVRGETTIKVHLSEIAMLIIENTAVSLTAALLCELTKKKVKIVFCDEQRNPSSELISYYGCHDSSAKIKLQQNWQDLTKGEVWRLVIKEKITWQKNLLKLSGKFEAATKLEQYATEVTCGDETNREGHAAKVYFNALFGKEFSRGDENPTNAALNYGYSIFLSMINREIVANGYLTQIGIFHDNMFNQFNLGSDLMEPFRPLVDELVYDIKPIKFEKEEKAQLLSVLNQTLIIENSQQHLINVVKIYCKSIFEALNQNDLSLVRFFRR